VIGNNGYEPVALKLLMGFNSLSVCCCARMYINVHSVREMRPELSREAVSVSAAKARFSGENTLTVHQVVEVYAMYMVVG